LLWLLRRCQSLADYGKGMKPTSGKIALGRGLELATIAVLLGQ